VLRIYAEDQAGNWALITLVFTIEASTPLNTNSTSTTTFFTTETSTRTSTPFTIDIFTFELFLTVFTLLAVFLRRRQKEKRSAD